MVIIENTRDKEEKFIIATQGARSVNEAPSGYIK